MSNFKHIPSDNDIRKMIKSAFDADLELDGAWGYSKEESTILQAKDNTVPIYQLEHTLALMRAYLEMNMTLEKEARYGSINVNEISREDFKNRGLHYHKINYEISAMKDEAYANFINEYKEGYGKDDFDLTEHFKKRKDATLTRVVVHWFEVSKVL
jgi:hypothetical protein